MLFIKDTYAKGGVTVELDPEDWPQMQKKMDGRDFDAITLGWSGSVESDLYQECSFSEWLAHTPAELVMAHLNIDRATYDGIPKLGISVTPL